MDPKTRAEIVELIAAGVRRGRADSAARKQLAARKVRKTAAPLDPRLVKIDRLAKEMGAATDTVTKERLGAEITLERLKMLRNEPRLRPEQAR